MLKFVQYCFLVLFVFSLIIGCVKDTDFDQAEDISLTPVIELDLIYFNLEAPDFFDSIANIPRLTVRDTTEIRFLDDGGVQESLRRAEFFFRFKNSLPRGFQVDFQFLSTNLDTTYTTGTLVAPGSLDNEVITEFTQNVEGDDIINITRADRVVVSVTTQSSLENLQGILNLQSKTTYYLEY